MAAAVPPLRSGVFSVVVDVALSRPPRADAQVFVVVQADGDCEAELAALHMAGCNPLVVMPVGSRIVGLVA